MAGFIPVNKDGERPAVRELQTTGIKLITQRANLVTRLKVLIYENKYPTTNNIEMLEKRKKFYDALTSIIKDAIDVGQKSIIDQLEVLEGDDGPS